MASKGTFKKTYNDPKKHRKNKPNTDFYTSLFKLRVQQSKYFLSRLD